MTRRRIIAGVILLAAVAVAVPFVPGVWRRVAYVQLPISSGPVMVMADQTVIVMGPGRDVFHAGDSIPRERKYPARLSDAESVVVVSRELTVYEKRHAWVPGDEFIVPDQVYPMCKTRNHTLCFPRHISGARFITPDGTRVDLPETFRCTCTDPSHDD